MQKINCWQVFRTLPWDRWTAALLQAGSQPGLCCAEMQRAEQSLHLAAIAAHGRAPEEARESDSGYRCTAAAPGASQGLDLGCVRGAAVPGMWHMGRAALQQLRQCGAPCSCATLQLLDKPLSERWERPGAHLSSAAWGTAGLHCCHEKPRRNLPAIRNASGMKAAQLGLQQQHHSQLEANLLATIHDIHKLWSTTPGAVSNPRCHHQLRVSSRAACSPSGAAAGASKQPGQEQAGKPGHLPAARYPRRAGTDSLAGQPRPG